MATIVTETSSGSNNNDKGDSFCCLANWLCVFLVYLADSTPVSSLLVLSTTVLLSTRV